MGRANSCGIVDVSKVDAVAGSTDGSGVADMVGDGAAGPPTPEIRGRLRATRPTATAAITAAANLN